MRRERANPSNAMTSESLRCWTWVCQADAPPAFYGGETEKARNKQLSWRSTTYKYDTCIVTLTSTQPGIENGS